MRIKELVKKSHENAVDKGFWDNWVWIKRDRLQGHTEHYYNAINTNLLEIVREVTEAMEGLRRGDMDNFKEELADTVIWIADLCGGLEIDLEEEIRKKMRINKERAYKHGKMF
ncbi:MazG nucleotide pyrophosphohydrolase domain-containing protein [Clostridium niameyense]|uniref:MazG nucleotide pyrophosphohydrolase domain-containing protein n=1 Tax=Clostridium niameyense TaxID=1622073 RepID=UPI00067F594C|nr:MazG nucleotide pyrophosphohydrolase domain-containing protein [Clostridium niameyense]